MTPRYHPSQATLLDYASGTASRGRALVISTHLRHCQACRQELALAEAVGGSLLNALEPTAMAPGALDAVLARLDQPTSPPARAPAQRPDWIEVPAAVIDAARRRKRWAAPGVWVAPISRGPGRESAYLLRIGAGMAVPMHTHSGVELICVLKGAYDDRGVIHEPGDLAENDESVEHRPTVTLDGECICLVCTDRPLVPLDWVGRIFQPFVGI